MSESRRCPGCGAGLPEDSPAGVCPGCRSAAAWAETQDHHPGGPRGGRGSATVRAASYPEFRESLLRTGLAAPADLEGLEAGADGDPTRLAVALVRGGKLTPYQAGALVQGKSRGLLIGCYLILDKLGEGGMGMVFKARHRQTRQVVALKILPPSFARDRDAVRRFRREFQVASLLDHPNLVAAVEADEDRGVHFLTMDYIVGRDLETLVRQDGPMPVPRALHCGIQAARGLEAAHARGVIHRDVKPANVMIDAHGNVRVLDLGLAKLLEAAGGLSRESEGSITRTGAYMGSVDFLAPEQADNAKRADHRADVYGLGCTLYFLLTGRPPFPGDTLLKRLIAHQHLPPPSIRELRPQVPEAMEAVYLRMMAKRPEERPQSMTEVIAALEGCRSSPREAGDASTDLKTFATTFMRRPDPRDPEPRGEVDADDLARPGEFLGIRFEPGPTLADLLSGSGPEATPSSPVGRPRAASIALAVLGLAALAMAVFALRPRPGVSEVARAGVPGPGPLPPELPLAPVFSTFESAQGQGPEPAVEPVPSDDPGAEAPDPGPAVEPAPFPPPSLQVYLDEFDDPGSGWRIEETPVPGSDTPYRKGYADGAYFMEAPGPWISWEAWDITAELASEYEVEAVARSIGPEDAYGGFSLFVVGAEGKGFNVSINPGGLLGIYGSPWAEEPAPHLFEPFSHPAIRGGGQWNALTLRVRTRSLEVLVNGEPACEPIGVDFDLLPSVPEIALGKGDDSRVRAEFDRLAVRLLDRGGRPALDDDGRALNLGFEEGTLRDWAAEGAATIGQPIDGDTVSPRGRDATSGHAGRFWVGTYEVGGDKATGRLSSVPFRVLEPYASLLVSGGDQPDCRVEVAVPDGPVIASFRGERREQLRPRAVDLSGHLGDRVVLRVIDESTEGWGHVNFDDFRFHAEPLGADPPGLSPSRVAYTEEFLQPATGWPRGRPDAGVEFGFDHRDGVYVVDAGRGWNGTRDIRRLRQFSGDFQVEAVGRVLGEAPDAAGAWGIMVVREDGRGIHAIIDRRSLLAVNPAFWGVEAFPDDRPIGPVRPRGIRPADRFNTLTLRVRGRQVEVLVNGLPAFDRAVALDYDLLPAAASLTLDKPDLETRVRVEYDRVQLRVPPPE
ncbi:serine/threonine-protein kinase [Tautonia plasticadhaerens]|uniref:Serine/threonine-protein kinase PrkC n=1 Tax=Tautonia plasticadhaerens TaxID=2527974 RepID=A0A518GV31_9BACT|nr:serine/threonine-protein kinase [Tautonia plasticadhaerens]QDV32443.1 Serine/threonine-protein kinase PrkC [Tautonia plasticadhaerens]